MRYGSSPLARGAQINIAKLTGYLRLIPAGAGSTESVPGAWALVKAHPRWRGEHSFRVPV